MDWPRAARPGRESRAGEAEPGPSIAHWGLHRSRGHLASHLAAKIAATKWGAGAPPPDSPVVRRGQRMSWTPIKPGAAVGADVTGDRGVGDERHESADKARSGAPVHRVADRPVVAGEVGPVDVRIAAPVGASAHRPRTAGRRRTAAGDTTGSGRCPPRCPPGIRGSDPVRCRSAPCYRSRRTGESSRPGHHGHAPRSRRWWHSDSRSGRRTARTGPGC